MVPFVAATTDVGILIVSVDAVVVAALMVAEIGVRLTIESPLMILVRPMTFRSSAKEKNELRSSGEFRRWT